MRITGLTVCVDYADLLEKSIDLWAACDRLLVVTTPEDSATRMLCAQHDVLIHQTRAFYRDGAVFNKGAALSEAIEAFDYLDDWCLIFDADMIPAKGWRGIVETSGLEPGNLYGAHRMMEDGSTNRSDDFELAGYFHLFHASDEHAQRKPLLDCRWVHAGGYDSEFQGRWPRDRKIRLPLTLTHQGKPGRNWFGRFNTEQMDKLLEDRQRAGKIVAYERRSVTI